MEITVKIDEASLADVVRVTYDSFEEQITTTTLGDVVTEAILDGLRADGGWTALVARFGRMVDAEIKRAAPGYIARLVAAEVTAQLTSTAQGAVTRGEPSTKAQAYVATEVTTQLRAAFAPVVEAALTKVRRELDALATEAEAEFQRRRPHP